MDAGSSCIWQKTDDYINQVIECKTLISKREDKLLLFCAKCIMDGVGLTAPILLVIPTLPFADCSRRYTASLCELSTAPRYLLHELPLLDIGSCVRMDLHADGLLVGLAIIKETTACTPFYSTHSVHNVMRLDNKWSDMRVTLGTETRTLQEARGSWVISRANWWNTNTQSWKTVGLPLDFPTTQYYSPWHGYYFKSLVDGLILTQR